MSWKRMQSSLKRHAHHLQKEFWVSIFWPLSRQMVKSTKKEIDKFSACVWGYVTLFLLKWLLAAQLGLLSPPRSIPLNPWAPEGEVDLLVSLLRGQWANSWGPCGLCVTQQECLEPLKVQEASACIQCPCCFRALYLIHKQFILPLLSLGESWVVTCDYCNWMAGCNLRAVT